MAADLKELVTRTQVNFGKAIEAYERTLLGGNSAFDRFVREGPDSDAISPTAKRGARLFVGKASCIDCHNGPLLSDGDYHNIGVPQMGDHVPTVVDCPEGSRAATARRVRRPAPACRPAPGRDGNVWSNDGAARAAINRFATTSFTRNSEWARRPDGSRRLLHPDRRELQGRVAHAQPARRRDHRALHARRLLPDPRRCRLALQRRRRRQRDGAVPRQHRARSERASRGFALCDMRGPRDAGAVGRPAQAAGAYATTRWPTWSSS